MWSILFLIFCIEWEIDLTFVLNAFLWEFFLNIFVWDFFWCCFAGPGHSSKKSWRKKNSNELDNLWTYQKKFEICVVFFWNILFRLHLKQLEIERKILHNWLTSFLMRYWVNQTHLHFAFNTSKWWKYLLFVSQNLRIFLIWIEYYFERKSKNLMWINMNIKAKGLFSQRNWIKMCVVFWFEWSHYNLFQCIERE